MRNRLNDVSEKIRKFFSKKIKSNEIKKFMDDIITSAIDQWCSNKNIDNITKNKLSNQIDRNIFVEFETKFCSLIGKQIDYSKNELDDILNNFYNIFIQEIEGEYAKILYDYNDIRNELTLDIKENVDKIYTFYYDETNNRRKLSIKNKDNKYKFNENVLADFILGGIAFSGLDFKGDIEKLFNDLKLEKNIKELKAHNILKSLKFEKCLKDKKLKTLLKWIDENDLLIHIHGVDNLYWVCQDIVDMVIIKELNEYKQGEKLIYTDILYRLVKNDISGFTNILGKYNYPQLANEQKKDYIDDLIAFLESKDLDRISKNDKLYELTKSITKNRLLDALKHSKLVEHNLKQYKNKYIIEDFTVFYQSLPIIYAKSKHIFDEEKLIQDIIDENPIFIDGKKIDCTYEKSIDNRMIQICDVVVSFMYKFIYFLNEHSLESIIASITNFQDDEKETYNLFIKILRKSYKNPYFFKLNGISYNQNKFYLFEKLTILNTSEMQKMVE